MCLLVTACSDDNNGNEPITPFKLDKTYYEVRLEQTSAAINITNGSGDISLSIEDENILNATYKDGLYADGLKGVITLRGKQKGNTMLTITDNVTGDKETVEVKVTDCYLAYAIANSNHPVLKAKTTLFFVSNPEKECYIFAIDNIHGKLYEQPIAKGSYEFFVTPPDDTTPQFKGIPCLHLNITDNDATTTSYDFQMKLWGEDTTSHYALSFIQSFLDVDWEKLLDEVQTKSPAPIDMTMTLTIPDTDYQITGVLSTASMPEHILD